MIYIQEVRGWEILESRGLPTIEVEILLSNGQKVWASSPSGTSYASEGAVEIRDKDMSRYHGYGVLRAVDYVNKTIAPRLYKKDPLDQFDIDQMLNDVDGTPNKAHLGTNTILATSMAVAKAGALSKKEALFIYLNNLYQKQYNHMYKSEDQEDEEIQDQILPLREMNMPEPIFNIINGRESENSRLDFQDFMIIFKGVPNYKDKLRYASEIDHQVKKIITGKDYYFTSLSNEGGSTPDMASDKKSLQIIQDAISQLESRLESSVYYGLDIAATGIYDNAKKIYRIKSGKKEITSQEMIEYLFKFSKEFPVIFFEDPLASNDFKNWKKMRENAPEFMGIVGDDLFNGDMEKLQKNKKEKWANAISIKPNQIGSVADILKTVILAQQQEMKVVFSHRSGETNDSSLSDFAVAVGAEYFKAGAPRKGERVAKYNRLMKIEEELNIIKMT